MSERHTAHESSSPLPKSPSSEIFAVDLNGEINALGGGIGKAASAINMVNPASVVRTRVL